MLRDIEVDDAASIVRQDNEDIEDLQANRCDCEEINGYQLPNMISKKGRPGLSRLGVLVRHQSRNRPLGNLKPEFALPSGDCLRLNEYESRSPILPESLERTPQYSISIAQSWPLFLTHENGQLMTKCDAFQGDLPMTTEDENEESKRQQKRVQHAQSLCCHLTEESTG